MRGVYLVLGPRDEEFLDVFRLAQGIVEKSLGVTMDVTVLYTPEERGVPRLGYNGVEVVLSNADIEELVDLLASIAVPGAAPNMVIEEHVGGEVV